MKRESRLVAVTTPLGRLANEAYTQLKIPFVRAAPLTYDSPVLRAEVWTSGTQLTIEMDEPADTWRIGTPDNILIAWMRRVREEVERSWDGLPAPK
jgi:hypothetical protein